MHEPNFFKYSRDEILRGIGYILDSEKLNNADPADPALSFGHDYALQKLSLLWLTSDQDMTLMRVKFADEIEQILEERKLYEKIRV